MAEREEKKVLPFTWAAIALVVFGGSLYASLSGLYGRTTKTSALHTPVLVTALLLAAALIIAVALPRTSRRARWCLALVTAVGSGLVLMLALTGPGAELIPLLLGAAAMDGVAIHLMRTGPAGRGVR
ncbi:hypothetical protein AB0D04_01175 [Streptomyces sp. NPDC048483]|uniref:hypothetical protein n=1 Tax=Streptomyces sp. NPDC048483 TaxID=3154927 RepID=UPI003427B911